MTTLKPQLVRADTLDLQSLDAPSAQDHSRQPQHPAPYGYGPAAPHQAQTLRHAEEDALHQKQTSPRVSDDGPHPGLFSADQAFYDDPDDEMDDDHVNHFHAVNGAHPQDHDYDDGDASDSHDEDMDDDLMDKISSSPSIEDEDIDFEFVYALHTFVATVEGQANATKGDTMVLLDDSNSYWWLVRVVKDGSIGYLPAEHIETPTERLARLNKHRNIDLSASMLGDNPEKSKNPLKKAMRRRNAKTVQFTAPTYYEPSEYDYSDDEEEEADESQLEPGDAAQRAADHPADDSEPTEQDAQDAAVARPAQDNQQHRDDNTAVNGLQKTTSNDSTNEDEPDQSTSQANPSTPDDSRPSSASPQEPVTKSRKGVVRNTDSFFKDDTAETKKITLTPPMLRGYSDLAVSADQTEVRRRVSEETFDKILTVDEKTKDQPRKEKKGMLSGLFKRKDKASKGPNSHDRSEKTSEDWQPPQSPVSKDSLDSITGPERRPSKLQKTPPIQQSPGLSPTESKAPTSDPPPPYSGATAVSSNTTYEADDNEAENGRAQGALTIQTQSLDLQSTAPTARPAFGQEGSTVHPSITDNTQSSLANQHGPSLAPNSLRSAALAADDESDVAEAAAAVGSQPQKTWNVSPVSDTQRGHRRNDSGMEISPINSAAADSSRAVEPDHSSQFADESEHAQEHNSTRATQKAAGSTPVDYEPSASTSKTSPSTATTHTLSTSRSTPTWCDASLRNYMENDQDIKDLLIIVHDNANVAPVSSDHPLMANLFSTERTKLTEMQSQLDNLLLGWVSRKNVTLSR